MTPDRPALRNATETDHRQIVQPLAEPIDASVQAANSCAAVADRGDLVRVATAGAAALLSAAKVSNDPAILIEVDSSVSGGQAHNRLDVMIRGRAVSASAIQKLSLLAGGLMYGSAAYGQPERAAAAPMPDGSPARQRAFQFNLPRPGGGSPERCAFQIVARTEAGVEHVEEFAIVLDTAAAKPVALVSGPMRRSGASGGARPYVVMYIEYATIDRGGSLSVKGWAVSLGPILAVQVFAGENRVADATMGGERADVATVFPAYPNARLSGFRLTMQLDHADRDAATVGARAICPNGFGHAVAIPVERLQRHDAPSAAGALIGTGQATPARPPPGPLPLPPLVPGPLPPPPPPLEPPPRPQASAGISMFCDAATLTGDGVLSVHGWAVSQAGIAQVRVLLNDNEVGLASFGHQRPDVAGIFPGVAMAQLSGFRFKQHIDHYAGDHSLRIIVRSLDAGEQERQLSVSAIPAARRQPAVKVPQGEPAFEMTPEQAAEFRFELDAPRLSHGVAIETVTGRLTINGWLLCRSGIAGFAVFLDDLCLGEAYYGLARQDVGAAFPDAPNALRSGYAFHCSPRSLRDGDHKVSLKIRANSGEELTQSFRITVKKTDDQQENAGICRRLPRVEADLMLGLLADMDYRPVFQLIVRQHGPVDVARWHTTLDALRLQPYLDWTMVVLAEDAATALATRAVIDDRVARLADHFAILTAADAEAWSAPLASGLNGRKTLHALLLPGDELGADALLELAVAAGRDAERELVYGDEVRISPISNEHEAFFKPDFSPDLLCSTNYIGRPWVATAALLGRTGATPASLTANGEYDVVLRCVELAAAVHHVPKPLCQRASLMLDRADQEFAALTAMLERRSIVAAVLPTPIAGTWRVKRVVAATAKVSIIIPTCAAFGYIETCIASLRAQTAYADFEIICIDNIPASQTARKAWLRQAANTVVEIPGAFNWSIFNNRAAEVAGGEFLLFLNDDIEITDPGWLDCLMEHGQRPEVGITGPRLLYRDGKVQHAGMFLSSHGLGRHAFRFAAADDPGYFGLALTQRNVIAVTGACMLVRKAIFDGLGRFDEAHAVVNNDLDFCLRAHRAGWLTVFTPYASLPHHERASRAAMPEVFELTQFDAAWQTTFAAGDPYFSPRLSRYYDDYRPDDEPVQRVVAGAPLFHSAEIKRILVVKLDHIGDFVTALPPIRRLRKFFPDASITVLAGPASRSLAALESCIDEFIPFIFFHARSQLGERELTMDDYAALAGQLRPYQFDLAVDLRKQVSTRDVLRHSGARFLAGFDYLGQFPFLDIALDWDGDRSLQRKRSHIVDDLLRLVDAIGHATETDRVIMQPGPTPMPLTELPPDIRALFEKPVVAVHPGAGNVTKQWPEQHFAALIDLLIEKNGVNVMLVGGPDEVELADSLIKSVLHPDAVACMTGRTSLAELPRLLKHCALYIGNDSGPKHIAAAVGIPTLGIHSGIVDPVEWGPIGPSAVALRRNMSCSPCYLANAEDCPRSLACLRLLEPSVVHATADLLLQRPKPVIKRELVDEIPAQPVPRPVRKAKPRPRLPATEAV